MLLPLILTVFAFALNFIWEVAQYPIFFEGRDTLWRHLPMCLRATLGDVIIILFFYTIISSIRRDKFWILHIRFLDLVLLVLLGFVWAAIIEKWALSTGRWQYTEAMPIVPFLQVGLVPVIQMILLPWVSFYLTKRSFEKLS